MNLRQKKKAYKNKSFALSDMYETLNLIMIKKVRGETLSKREKRFIE